MNTATVRVTVDHDLCSGTGQCAAAYPEFFVVRERKSWIRVDGLDVVDSDRVRLASAACPWFAIDVGSGDASASGPVDALPSAGNE